MQHLVFASGVGFEPIAVAELQERYGLSARLVAPGRLAAQVNAPIDQLVPALNFGLRCFDRVGVLLGSARARSLEAIGAIVAQADVEAWLAAGMSFAVRGERRGEHDFRSFQIAARAGAAVIQRMQLCTGRRPAVDLTDPDVIVRAELFDDRFLVWLDTTGDLGLHHRAYRGYTHMASMRPTTANLMLRLSGWVGGTLIDPFCGSATILIEAGHVAAGTPPGALRGRGWAWQRLPRFAGAEVNAERRLDEGAVPDDATGPPYLFGVERFSRHLRGGLENVGRAGLASVTRIYSGLAEGLDVLLPSRREGETRTVVTNPPFGRRVGSARLVGTLYRDAAAAWRRAGVGRVVTLAEREGDMAEALTAGGYRIRRRVPIVYGRMPVTVFCADREAN